MKGFQTRIKLSTVYHEHPTYDEFMLQYNEKIVYNIIEYLAASKIPSSFAWHVSLLFVYAGVANFLRKSEDKCVKNFPEELFLLHDMNSNPRLSWFAPVNGELVIKTDGLPKNAKINHDSHGILTYY